MLGILADESCPAARLLRRHGVRADRLRDKLDMPLDGTHERSPEDATCLNAQATFAMSGASILARRTGTREITPMHLLLALMIPPDAADAFGLRHDQIESLREDARAALDA